MNCKSFLCGTGSENVVAALLLAVLGVTLAGLDAAAAPTCTISWDRGAGTDFWDNAGNWTGDRVPNSGDHVCLTVNPTGAAVVHRQSTTTIKSLQRDSAGDEPLLLSGGRLDISDSETSDVDRITQSGGILGGTATVSVANLTWTEGTQDVRGHSGVHRRATAGLREGDVELLVALVEHVRSDGHLDLLDLVPGGE
ncbi:MAG: hypothetical protein M3515_05800, partial [Actinomycetota bacterium]|nr:hypothetical protein [Actinomycetota bacterium]